MGSVTWADALIWLMMAGCGAFAAWSAFQWWRSVSTRQWPTTRGRILETRLEPGAKSTVTPRVSYRFAVGGEWYRGNTISILLFGLSRTQADAVLARYAVGTEVEVHYHPRNPRLSVLETTVDTGGHIVRVFLGLILVCIGLEYQFDFFGLF